METSLVTQVAGANKLALQEGVNRFLADANASLSDAEWLRWWAGSAFLKESERERLAVIAGNIDALLAQGQESVRSHRILLSLRSLLARLHKWQTQLFARCEVNE